MKYLFDSGRNQASNRKHLLELVKTESAKSRGLRGTMGYAVACVAWVKFLRELRGLCESKCFLLESKFYVRHNFYVGCVGQIYFCVDQHFLRGSIFFTWVNIFRVS